MFIFQAVLSFLGGAVGKYVLIGALALGGLAWVRHNAAAPYKAEIASLRIAAQKKEAIVEADTARKLADVAETEEENTRLRDIISTLSVTSCRPEPAQLERLKKL